uniref:Uncharacterized protein n=1 Tax=Anguilla anguilla TaxID=7936 RepID=A0A0E9R2L9_ANGAN
MRRTSETQTVKHFYRAVSSLEGDFIFLRDYSLLHWKIWTRWALAWTTHKL